MKVLVIPEDPTLDQYIIKPIVEHICADLGVTARVDVLQDPHLRGVDEALAKDTVAEIIRDNPMEDLFLIIVDRDCNRRGNLEKAAAREGEHASRLIACLAREEVEVWMLALHRSNLGARWQDVRADCDPKERYSDPFLKRMDWLQLVGRGRKRAMRSLGSEWSGLLAVCDELAELRERMKAWFTQHGVLSS